MHHQWFVGAAVASLSFAKPAPVLAESAPASVATPAIIQSSWRVERTQPAALSVAAAKPVLSPSARRLEQTQAVLARSTWRLKATNSAAVKWEIAYQALNVIDAAQTIYCLEKVKGCYESNPLWGKNPSAKTVVLAKLGFGLTQYYLWNQVRKKNPRMALRAAQVSVALQGAVVGLNARMTFK